MDLVNQTSQVLKIFAPYLPKEQSVTLQPNETIDFPLCYFHQVDVQVKNIPEDTCKFYLSTSSKECTYSCSGNLYVELSTVNGTYRLVFSYQL